MTTRYFEIRSPRADFTGKIGAVSFADGRALVSFEDERDDSGLSVRDEHTVQTGRSAVLFARRRAGYTATEVDAAGQPLPDPEPDDKPARRRTTKATATKTPPPADDASDFDWRVYAVEQAGMKPEEIKDMTREQLIEAVKKGQTK